MTGDRVPERRLLQALRREPVDRPPLWLMRQAGRYLPEYREVRAGAKDFLELCYTPHLAAEVTLQPLRRFDLDAAIIFSDILVIPDALGQPVSFVEGRGPVLDPLETEKDIGDMTPDGVTGRLEAVYEALRTVRGMMPPEKALLGFCGAPWTIASYMIEGGSSRDFGTIRKWAALHPDRLAKLFEVLENALAAHLIEQIRAGADAVQIFDSWAGVLSDADFERWSVGPISRIARAVKSECPDTPVIAFPRLAGVRYLDFTKIPEIDAVSIDQSMPCGWVSENLQPHLAVQGNLDPMILLAGGDVLDREADRILNCLGNRPGFVFNLGHGVIKETPPEHVAQLCRRVAGWKAARG